MGGTWWTDLLIALACGLLLAWLALITVLITARPRGGMLREALRILPDLLRLLPGVRVLVRTASAGGGVVDRARRAGAVGCVFKGGAAEDLVSAVRIVAAGRTAWPSDPLAVSAGPGW